MRTLGTRTRTTFRIAITTATVCGLLIALPGVAAATAPGNDNFADATVISGSSGGVQGSTVGATEEPGQPEPFNDNTASNHYTVWYSWTAPGDGTASFGITGGNNGQLAAYTGDALDALTLQGAQTISDPGPLDVAVSTGTVLHILVGGKNGNPAPFQLNWNFGRPANDDITQANLLQGQPSVLFPGVARGSSVDATKEPGEPDHAGQAGGASVWWAWSPNHGGEQITFDTVGSTFDTVLAVYTRAGDGTLTPVAADNDSAGAGASRVTFTGTYGVTFLIAVDGVAGASGAVTLHYYVPPPANDDFADATAVSGASGSTTGTNSGATLEPGEPNHYRTGTFAQKSVWWRWTAPADGYYAFDVTTSTSPTAPGTAHFSPVVQVYDGTAVDALTPMTSVVGFVTTAQFNATAGHEYHVAVASDGSFGSIVLRWSARPGNDDFAAATVLTGTSGSVTGSTIAATEEPGQPEPFNDNTGSNHYTVWYAWTAPVDGSTTFDTTGSQNAQLAVYTGDSLDALTLQGAQTITSSAPISIAATAGTTVYVMVGGKSGRPGDYQLNWNVGAPGNDDIADASAVQGQSSVLFPDVVHGSSLGATKEPGEPDHAGQAGGASVWWVWSPNHGGEQITFDTVGSSFDTVLAVYTRAGDGSLTPVAADNDSAGEGASRVTFAATFGVNYYVAVDGVGGASGSVTLRYYVPPPVNDDFADATVISGAAGSVTGTNSGATLEPGEPNPVTLGPPSQKSVWWRWTAPADGHYAFDVNASTSPTAPGTGQFVPIMMVYAGDALDNLTPMSTTIGAHTTVGFDAVGGREYHIVVANSQFFSQSFGTIVLRWGNKPANDDFADAAPLATSPGSVSGSTVGATEEPGQPEPFNDNSGSNYYTVWYSWTAANDGTATFDTSGSQNAQIAVYTGDSLDSLSLQQAQTLAYNGPLDIQVSSGTTLYVMVGGRFGQPGDYQLDLHFAPTGPAGQTITVQAAAPATARYGDNFTVNASASSGLPVSYASSGSCSNTGPTFTITQASGTCTVTISQPGNDDYLPATPVIETVSAQRAEQHITFSLSGVAKTYGDYNFSLLIYAHSSSGLPVAFRSETPDVCALTGDTVIIEGAGICTIDANQPGNAGFAPAAQVTQSITIMPATLDVTADDQTVQQGDPLPALTVHDTGFVGSDDPTVLGGALSCDTTATVTNGQVVSPPGTYLITCDGLASDDYTFSYHGGTLTVIDADTTPPSITASANPVPNANGWNNSAVTVSFACTDSGSGVDVADSSLADQVLTVSGTATGTCVDNAGNSASAHYQAKIDPVDPTVTYTGNAGSYGILDTVAISCTSADALSGIDSSTCPDANGPAWSFGAGAHTLTAQATDKAGNTASSHTTFTVTVTGADLARLTSAFVTSSAKYRSDNPLTRLVIATRLLVAESPLFGLNASTKPATKTRLVTVYATQLNGLVTSGYLTAAQRTILVGLANAI